jgi:F0F1-type ATP synthase assembly protein I
MGYASNGGCMRRKKKYDKSVYRSFTLISQFGINMLVPIGMMTWLGIFLDKKFDTSYWMVILFFVGAIAGGQNVYRLSKRIYGAKDGTQSKTETKGNNGREIKKD